MKMVANFCLLKGSHARSSHQRCPIRLKTWNSNEKIHQHRYFSVNIANSLRTPILRNICERLVLKWLPMKVLSKVNSSNFIKRTVGYFLMFLFQYVFDPLSNKSLLNIHQFLTIFLPQFEMIIDYTRTL